MDMITLAMAKAYADSQRLAYPEQAVILSGELTDGAYQDSTHKLEGGKAYTLKLDSGTYSGVAIDLENAGILIYFGNLAVMGSDFADMDTGESYCVGYMSSDSLFIVADTNNGKGFALEGETIHPIDPKYLPGVCLPVVEITDIENITAEENAKLTACIGKPCIIEITVEDMAASTVATYQCFEGYHSFTMTAFGATASFGSTDGITWTAQ